ncbi:MAG: hypothetical protein WAK17_27075 [Candidatus Nitrosopolaris sp.]|jgi:hypothetical protein
MSANSSTNENRLNPVKQAHRICEKTLLVIAEDLVRRFGIDENTWFEQIPDENGIFLRIRRCP